MRGIHVSIGIAAAWLGLVAGAVAADTRATIERPNQFPSPSVKQPADDDLFDDNYPWDQNTLTGDWGGVRGQLAEQGVVFGIRYVSLLLNNTHGGFDTGFFGAGPLGITATIDSERLIGVDGGTLFFDWEFNYWLNGRFPPDGRFDPTGSYVGVNTNLIDIDDPRLSQVAQLYYKQALLDDRAALAFGKMDANVPFVDVEAAAGFQNSIAMYTSTLNPFIPTYPSEATGLVAWLGDSDESFVTGKFGWFDGTTAAYDPATGASGPDTGPRGPSTFFNNGGNWLLISQADFAWQVDSTLPGSLGIGAWVHTGLSATAGSNAAGVRDVPGWYTQWQQTVWAPSDEIAADGGGIMYFGQFGWSDPSKNAVHWSLMTGVSATGILNNRPADAVGLMFAHSQFSDNPSVFQSERRNGQPGPTGGSEVSLESFYIWQLTSWAYAQPGIMWIGTPGGGDPAPLDDAVIVYLAVGVEL